jgi:hypothetical protein
MTLDPNVWTSLARQYTGGMAAPVTGQAGYTAIVNADENNIEYVPPQATISLIADGTIVGYRYWYHRQLSLSSTGTVELLRIPLPEGMYYLHLYVSATNATDAYLLASRKYVLTQWGGALTSRGTVDSDAIDNIAGSITTAPDGGDYLIEASHDAADGTLVWTASVRIWRHGA